MVKIKKQKRFVFFAAIIAVLCLVSGINARIKIAFLTPEKTDQSSEIRMKLAELLADKIKTLDFSLSEAVFSSKEFANPFNLSTEEARNLGTAIGCDFFILLKTDTLQRFSLDSKDYVESYLAVYLVSSRTGRLVFWNLISRKGDDAEKARINLSNALGETAQKIFIKTEEVRKKEIDEETLKIEEPPLEDSPEAQNFRPPLPFKRLRPNYTGTAYLYNITATVDVLVDIGKNGEILRTEVTRWAGFGLDESAISTIRKMNWRPAERNGTFLPMRILIRYNFKKIG